MEAGVGLGVLGGAPASGVSRPLCDDELIMEGMRQTTGCLSLLVMGTCGARAGACPHICSLIHVCVCVGVCMPTQACSWRGPVQRSAHLCNGGGGVCAPLGACRRV